MYDLDALLLTFSASLLLTLFFELPIALLFGLRGKDMLLALPVNILTNPLAVYLNLLLLELLPSVNAFIWQLPLEALVIFAEGFLYRRFSYNIRHPLVLAVSANCLSYGCGLVINLIF